VKSPRFLILRGGAIGDFILTLPALAALRRRWPDGQIELVGYPHIAGLAVAGGLADHVTSLEQAEVAQYFSFRPSISEEQAAFIRSFNVVISYLYDPSGVVCRNLERAGAKQVIYGTPRVESGHAVEHLMQPLGRLALFPEGLEYPRLTLGADRVGEGRKTVDAVGARVIAIHPGSGSAKKNWPLDRYLALAERLRAAMALTPLFTVGEADEEIRAALEASAAFSILARTGLVELAGVLSACVGYVGNDSGITQLAAALGVPAVCLYGPTDPATWAPRGPNARVICAPERTSEGLARIEVDAVLAALLAAARK
jgi:ADP-heptose:LPS heptosyltransferase